MSTTTQLKAGFIFKGGTKHQLMLDLLAGLVRPEVLNSVQVGRVVNLWDNALLASRRERLLAVGYFVSRKEAKTSNPKGGGRRGRNPGGRQWVAGAGSDVHAGGASGRSRTTMPPRRPVFAPRDDITTRTWAQLVKLVGHHGMARSPSELEALSPGDPVPLRTDDLPPLLMKTLLAHGSLEYHAA